MAPAMLGLGCAAWSAALMARPTSFVQLQRRVAPAGSPGLTARAAGETITLTAGDEDLGPDPLVYGLVKGAAAGEGLPEGAVFLGPQAVGADSVFTVDAPFEELVVFSLGHGEVKARVAVSGDGSR